MGAMLRRRRPKRVVDMTNQEAAQFYAGRAHLAESSRNFIRANHLYRTAILHDADNEEAKAGVARTDPLCESVNATAAPVLTARRESHRRHHRHHRKSWWKRLLHIG